MTVAKSCWSPRDTPIIDRRRLTAIRWRTPLPPECETTDGHDAPMCNGRDAKQKGVACHKSACGDGYANKLFVDVSAPLGEDCDPGSDSNGTRWIPSSAIRIARGRGAAMATRIQNSLRRGRRRWRSVTTWMALILPGVMAITMGTMGPAAVVFRLAATDTSTACIAREELLAQRSVSVTRIVRAGGAVESAIVCDRVDGITAWDVL